MPPVHINAALQTGKQAVVLLSGGLDSATLLAHVSAQGYGMHALSFHYGQRHVRELRVAQQLVAQLPYPLIHKTVLLDLRTFGGSALTDTLAVPKYPNIEARPTHATPATYVPARNTIFLSYALAYAEVQGITDIFIGVNAVDYSNYPDCRPAYIAAFNAMAALATESSPAKPAITVHAPFVDWPKHRIIQHGMTLGVDYALTLSCYDPDEEGRACGRCESCLLRRRGFEEAGFADPARYRAFSTVYGVE
jgi:7-cyano-7-deazaguanine synthase